MEADFSPSLGGVLGMRPILLASGRGGDKGYILGLYLRTRGRVHLCLQALSSSHPVKCLT